MKKLAKLKMKKRTFRDFNDENYGFCRYCNNVVFDVSIEPDARYYDCPDCEGKTMFGIEEAMMMGLFEICGDDEEETVAY